jgi:Ca2+-binding RTX toxin-like protein
MATLTVGAGQQYATIGAAVAASHDGDVLQVQAGTYTNDFATINTKITLQGVGGMVKMVATGNIPNDKGILVTNTDVTIDHFEFSGAKGPSGNDAGIRYQDGALTITNSYFHDNQNGLLSNPSATGTIDISHSEFDHNGAGDGYTHNLYVGDIASLTISDSYFHDAVVGHEIKSRAEVTSITNTRIFDNGGSASYSIDLPNGGKATIAGNTIQQGANSENPIIVAYGEEGGLHSGSSLTMTNNTVVNDLTAHQAIVLNDASGTSASLTGTQIYGLGNGTVVQGSGVAASGTTTLSSHPTLDTSHPFDGSNTPPTGGGGGAGGSALTGSAADDTLQGGAGPDTISGGDGHNYLRGNDGNDSITGGSGFDDINGNKGDDTAHGGEGNDWVVGGQDQDLLFGEHGNDVVYGNLGNDTVNGGAGDDWVRGGQGDDVVEGGAGNDLIWGDRGNDTIAGGAGADMFHTFVGAGVDRVTDFNGAEGDRIVIDDHADYTVTASGGDTIITLAGTSDTLVLQGVALSNFHSDWVSAA